MKRKRKAKEEIAVAPPKETAAGKYRGRVMVDGQRVWITEDTEAAYYIRAKAIKAKMIEQAKSLPKDALGDLIDRYIADNEAVLSPPTVESYRSMRRTRFAAYIGSSVRSIEWQRMISDETKIVSAKTVKNAWGLVTASLQYAKIDTPNVTLLSVAKNETEFLDFEQIQKFTKVIKGTPYEAAYLLALHSLRLSEMYTITAKECTDSVIAVRGAVVHGKDGRKYKELNKTDLSRRDVPIMIPRLTELLCALPVTVHDKTLNKHLRRICKASGLPEITMHGLRHSFASLAYHLRWTEKSTMQLGGWSTPDVVHNIYTHLAARDKNDDVEKMRRFYTVV